MEILKLEALLHFLLQMLTVLKSFKNRYISSDNGSEKSSTVIGNIKFDL